MQKAKVLIIDDEKDFLELMSEKLELEGYETITAGNGEEGLQKAFTHKPEVIICDVIMPKKDGYEVLKGVRRERNLNTVFIMMTVVDDFEKVKQAYNEEADFYVTKPVHLNTLLKNIKILLNLRKMEKTP